MNEWYFERIHYQIMNIIYYDFILGKKPLLIEDCLVKLNLRHYFHNSFSCLSFDYLICFFIWIPNVFLFCFVLLYMNIQKLCCHINQSNIVDDDCWPKKKPKARIMKFSTWKPLMVESLNNLLLWPYGHRFHI